MSSRKWTAQDISGFLDIFHQHEILWNINDKDNANKSKRERAFNRLLQEINNTGKNVTMEDLKNKIKIIRTVYRKEARKVERSKVTGKSPEEIYKPRLSWFSKADSFLNQSNLNRSALTYLDLNMVEDSGQEEVNCSEIGDTPEVENSYTNTTMQPPPMNPVVKRRKCNCLRTPVENAIVQLEKVIERCHSQIDKQEDEFDIFAKYIACQLRKLPPRNAIIVQQQIQNVVITELLQTMPSPVHKMSSPT